MEDVGCRLSKLMLVCTVLNAALHLAASIRTRGLCRSALFFVLGLGLPADYQRQGAPSETIGRQTGRDGSLFRVSRPV